MYSLGPSIQSPVNYEAIKSIQKIEKMKDSLSTKLGISVDEMNKFLYDRMGLPNHEDFIATRDVRALNAATDLMTTYLSSEKSLRKDISEIQNPKQEKKKKGFGNHLKTAGIMSLYVSAIGLGGVVAYDLSNGSNENANAYDAYPCIYVEPWTPRDPMGGPHQYDLYYYSDTISNLWGAFHGLNGTYGVVNDSVFVDRLMEAKGRYSCIEYRPEYKTFNNDLDAVFQSISNANVSSSTEIINYKNSTGQEHISVKMLKSIIERVEKQRDEVAQAPKFPGASTPEQVLGTQKEGSQPSTQTPTEKPTIPEQGNGDTTTVINPIPGMPPIEVPTQTTYTVDGNVVAAGIGSGIAGVIGGIFLGRRKWKAK